MDKLYGKIIGLILHVCLCILVSYMYILYILLVSSFIYLYIYIYIYIYILYVCLLRFLPALNFFFCEAKMFKLLFILFVSKQLLGNLTSNIDTYSSKLSIIRLGIAKW